MWQLLLIFFYCDALLVSRFVQKDIQLKISSVLTELVCEQKWKTNRKTSRTSVRWNWKKFKHQYQIIIMLDCIQKNLRKMYAYGAFLLVMKLFLWTMIRSFKQKGIRLLALRMTDILDSIFSQKLLQYPLCVLEL